MRTEVTIRSTSKGHIGSAIAAKIGASGPFNHCMLLIGLRAYEAVPIHGVRAVPHHIAMRGVRRYQDRMVMMPDIESMVRFLESKLGAGYDWPGAIGLPFHHSGEWQDQDLWWCWELVAAALAAGGVHVVAKKAASFVVPHDIYRLDVPTSQIIHIPKPKG